MHSCLPLRFRFDYTIDLTQASEQGICSRHHKQYSVYTLDPQFASRCISADMQWIGIYILRLCAIVLECRNGEWFTNDVGNTVLKTSLMNDGCVIISFYIEGIKL